MIKRANQASLELKEQLGPEAEELIARIRERARNLYLNHQLLCAEAVMVALNNGLDGGLRESQAIAIYIYKDAGQRLIDYGFHGIGIPALPATGIESYIFNFEKRITEGFYR